MALKPEFIGLLRDIRDRIFPSVNASEIVCTDAKSRIEEINTAIKDISVKSPITVVPVQENGDPGLPNVIYNPTTNQFEFSIPAGSDGQDLSIKYTVALTADLYLINTVLTGEVAFSNEDSKVYVKLDTGTNVNAADWSSGTVITPTTLFKDMTDTPLNYVGYGEYILAVKADETGITYRTLADLGSALFDAKANLSGAIFTGQVKGITPVSAEDLTRKDYVETFVSNAIAGLLDSAPGTLDTLNELAAALGDDPNFATTMTTALASKVSSDPSAVVGADQVTNMMSLTQAEYDTITTPDASTLYIIVG